MLKKLLMPINIGTKGLSEKIARGTRVTNAMAFIALGCSLIYAAFYVYIEEPVPALINLMSTALYSLTWLMNYLKKRDSAKAWIIFVYMLHLFILTKFIFSPATGFHYYIMATLPMSFLIYGYHQFISKSFACIIALTLFFVCEVVHFSAPLVPLSAEINKLLHLSSILFLFTGIFFIIFLFSNNIKKNEDDLEASIRKLEKAMSEIKTLQGLIPICSSCKKIRDDKGFWNHLEAHIQKHSYATFSHGICPECSDEIYGKENWYKEMKIKGE